MKPRLLCHLYDQQARLSFCLKGEMKMAELISKIVLVIILVAEHLKGGKPHA